MICQVVAPIACAASTRPWSTSRSAVSTRRAIKGADAMVSGTMAAEVPIEVPTKKRVNGITATNRMMKGVERTALTSRPATRLKSVLGRIPLGSVRCSAAPSGTPRRAPKMPEMPTIISVSPKELIKRSSISDDMVQLLNDDALGTQIIHGIGNIFSGTVGKNCQRTKRLTLNFIDLTMQDVEIQVKTANCLGQMWLIYTRTGEGKAKQMISPCAGFSVGQSRTQAFQYTSGQLMSNHIANQRTRDIMLGLTEHVEYLTRLNDLASLHDGDPITDHLDHFHLVGNQYDSQSQFLVDLA